MNNNLSQTKVYNQNDNQFSTLICLANTKSSVSRETVTVHSDLNMRVKGNTAFRCLISLT